MGFAQKHGQPGSGQDYEAWSIEFSREKGSLVFGAAVSVLVVMYSCLFIAKPDQFFADDTYLSPGSLELARGMGSTFNTIMPTNGYHPLWMLLCADVYKTIPSKTVGIHGIAMLVTGSIFRCCWPFDAC
jgi:hypothetical protein